MTPTYVRLVEAYVRHGEESALDAIGALRHELIENEIPIEELVGMHERAVLALKNKITSQTFEELVIKTSTCFTELAIAYSLADEKKQVIRDKRLHVERERQRLESLGQMAGGVAHEFNNLLQPIVGMAEMAIEDVEPGGELCLQLKVILDCATQAAAIVHGILSIARKQRPAAQSRPFAPGLRKAIQFLSAILPRTIQFDLSISCGDECVVYDDSELGQVLLNFARNASDAMGGKGAIEITLERWEGARAAAPERPTVVCAPPSYLRLGVRDSGVGMSADVAARAFQPFFTTKAPTEGTGLGLSTAMAIVHGWNGELEIDTAPGAGTRVSLFLPVLQERS